MPGFMEEAEKEDDQYPIMAEKILCDIFMGVPLARLLVGLRAGGGGVSK